MSGRYAAWTVVAGVVALAVLFAGVALGLQGSLKPRTCPTGPTAAKTQSKLWFNDGSWWGVLFDGASEEFRIYRYEASSERWRDTGTTVDERNTSRADVLWDGPHLYVASAGTEADLSGDSARFLRFSYDAGSGRYALDEGFPVTISSGGTEAIAIDRAADGEVWATYAQGEDLREVYVTHTEGDDREWVEPFVPPLPGTTVSSDDVASVVAFGDDIGLMWSNQYDSSGQSGYHFAVHEAGTPDDRWRSDDPVLEAGMTNDHLNLKADAAGRVYATTKTRRDRIDRDLDAPYGVLWVRDPDGGWRSHVYSRVRDYYTRSLLLIDERRDTLYVLGTSPTCSGGEIYYKTADLGDPDFEEGRGELFMQGAGGEKIGDATSTKGNIGGRERVPVIASSTTGGYYYNLIDTSTGEKVLRDGSPITGAGWGP